MGCIGSKRSTAVVNEAKVNLEGKVVIVTGANSGLGKQSSAMFGSLGATVVMAGRSMERLEAAARDIKTVQPAAKLECMELDLGSLASVRSFVEGFLDRHNSLHVLMNNAGIMATPFAKTVDGFELQFGVNFLGPFLLTELLLPTLKASAPSRVVIVSSIAHNVGTLRSKLEYHRNPTEAGYPGSSWIAYGTSKQANIIHARVLGKKLEGSNVSVFSLHPGNIPTELGRNNCLARCFYATFNPCFKDIDQGSATQMWCAIQPGIERFSGSYAKDLKFVSPSKSCLDDTFNNQVYSTALELVGLEQSNT